MLIRKQIQCVGRIMTFFSCSMNIPLHPAPAPPPLLASQCAVRCSRTCRGDLLPRCSAVLAKKAAAVPGASPRQTEQMPSTNKQHSGFWVDLPVKPPLLQSTQSAELSNCSRQCISNTDCKSQHAEKLQWVAGVQLLLFLPADCASFNYSFVHKVIFFSCMCNLYLYMKWNDILMEMSKRRHLRVKNW